MYSMNLTIRKDGNRWFVEGETSEPALAAGTKVSARLELDVNRLQQLAVARDLDELRAYGRMLGEAVFVGDIRSIFHEVLGRVPHDDVLHVSLSVEDVELRSFRWERLCCPLHNRKDSPWEFLHLRQETAYSLDLRSAVDRRYPAISRVGLKALVVVADMGPTRPNKLADFNASETVAGIRAALGKDIACHVLASSGASQLPNSDGLPTLDEICRWLTRERFAILHLVCHGEFKQWEEPGPNEKPVSKSDTFLYLRKAGEIDPTKKDDHVARVSGTDFLQRLRQLQVLPHLTFLCSCSSASAEAEQGLGGLGQRLVRELAMPAVVAMTEPVPIDLATEISREFYNHLQQTGEVDRALTKASASQAGRSTVLVPTHFSRLAGRRLFDDSLELTTAEWEHGLNRLAALIQERAPVLATTFDKLLKVVQPALEIWRTAERSGKDKRTEDEKQAGATLLARKAELNELCQDFLENSFDHLAKDKSLTFPTFDGRCPFPGLGVFDKVKSGDKEEDFRPFFFGRDPLIREIRELLNRNRFVAVLGGSGSGKSSLIRAGLLEAMRREKPELRAIVFPPGKDPLVRLQTELAAIPNPDFLVVDQFEELFTLCTDLAQRKEFLKQLLPLKDQFPVVITMRADFLGECAGHDDLHQLLDAPDDKHLKLIQSLKGSELRSVMEQQAEAVGLKFEPGLAASLFDDLEGEPGAMPLLQHCLRQLWQQRHGAWLRLVEYANKDRVGGVKGAISRTAEDVYQQLVNDEAEASTLLPFIFERLARIDTSVSDPEQRRDTRRREELTELTPAGSDSQVVKLIVTRLADAKLVVTTQNLQTGKTEVEVAHEALIRTWPRLQNWLNAARDTVRLVDRIRDAADNYQALPLADNLTLRGSVLKEAEILLESQAIRLSREEETFVRSCRELENERTNSELEKAQQQVALADRAARSARWTRNITTIASVAVLCLMLGLYIQNRISLARSNKSLFLQIAEPDDERTSFVGDKFILKAIPSEGALAHLMSLKAPISISIARNVMPDPQERDDDNHKMDIATQNCERVAETCRLIGRLPSIGRLHFYNHSVAQCPDSDWLDTCLLAIHANPQCRTLTLGSVEGLTPQHIESIGKIVHLENLSFKQSVLFKDAFSQLKNPRLLILDVTNTGVDTDTGELQLLRGLPKLHTLKISLPPAGGLSAINHMTSLHELEITVKGHRSVHSLDEQQLDDISESLKGMSSLQVLRLIPSPPIFVVSEVREQLEQRVARQLKNTRVIVDVEMPMNNAP